MRRDGQLLLWMTCNLICRLRKLVDKVEIHVPSSVKMSTPPYIPFGSTSSNLRASLSYALRLCARDCNVECIDDDLQSQFDAVIVIGQDTATCAKAGFVKSVACSGWLAYVGDRDDLCSLTLPDTNNPFGAFAAACLVVGEVFKYVCKMKPDKGEMIESLCFSAYDLQCHFKPWKNLENPPLGNHVRLGNLHICGAGAVAHAFCQTLFPITGLNGNLFFIDRSADPNSPYEAITPTNLARYIMATNSDESSHKARLLADRMSLNGISTDFSDDGVQTYINSNNTKFSHVISCVDNNAARHAIQYQIPKMIHGGSTSELRSQVSIYDLAYDECQCLKCYNDMEDTAIDDDPRKKLANMSVEERKVLAVERGVNPDIVEQYLRDPTCGSLGNDSIQKFADTNNMSEFSVNFVSTLTGVLLAGEIVKSKNRPLVPTLDGRQKADASYAFFSNTCRLSPIKPKSSCWCSHGVSTPRDIHKQIWSVVHKAQSRRGLI